MEGPLPVGADGEGSRTRGYLKNTLKHGTIYSLGVVLSRLIGFVMIPVYTRVLTPTDYGVLEILSLTADVFAMLAGMGIGMAVIRYYYYYDSVEDRNSVVSSAAIVTLTIFSLIAITALIFAKPASMLLLGTADSAGLVPLAALNVALGASVEVPLVLMRARQNSFAVVVAGLARLLIGLTLNIVFVVIMRLGVAGVLLSSCIASGAVGGYLLAGLFRETGFRFSMSTTRKLVAFGAPLVIWEIGSFVLHFSDRYFLRIYDSLASVGLYSLSYKLAMLISLFVSGPFTNIWVPKALEIERKEGEGAIPILASIVQYYNLILVTVAVGVALFASDVIRLVTGPEFHSAGRPVPVLALAMVLFGYRGVAQVGALIRERSDLVAKSTTAAAVAVILLNMLLIPRWGVQGAAIATASAFAIEFLLMRRFSMRVYALHISLPTLLQPIVWGVLTILAARFLLAEDAALLPSIAIRTMLFGGYLTSLLFAGPLTANERRAILALVRDPRRLRQAIKGV